MGRDNGMNMSYIISVSLDILEALSQSCSQALATHHITLITHFICPYSDV